MPTPLNGIPPRIPAALFRAYLPPAIIPEAFLLANRPTNLWRLANEDDPQRTEEQWLLKPIVGWCFMGLYFPNLPNTLGIIRIHHRIPISQPKSGMTEGFENCDNMLTTVTSYIHLYSIHSCMHACMHSFIHSFTHTRNHERKLKYVLTYIHRYVCVWLCIIYIILYYIQYKQIIQRLKSKFVAPNRNGTSNILVYFYYIYIN